MGFFFLSGHGSVSFVFGILDRLHKILIRPADNDNNHELCLDTTDVPVSVSFPAGYLTDPNSDLNPATSIEVIQQG
jgi:hypothetical protein